MYRKIKIFITLLIEKIVYLLFFPWYYIMKENRTPQKQKIFLLSRLDLIGDVLMTTPAIRAIKEQYPDSKIYLLINKSCSDIVKDNPFIDAVFYYSWPWSSRISKNHFSSIDIRGYFRLFKQLRKINADTFIEFRGDIRMIFLFGFLLGIPRRISSLRTGGRSFLTDYMIYDKNKHELERVLSLLQPLNVLAAKKRSEIFYLENDMKFADDLIKDKLSDIHAHYAIIAPFSGKEVKEWVPERWAEIADHLFEKYKLRSFIVGSRNDREAAENILQFANNGLINLTGQTSLKQLAVLMSRSQLVLGVDSGSMHLASCFDIPIIALFGPTHQNEFKPYSPFAKIVDLNICQCNKDKHDICQNPKNGCAFCMHEITCKHLYQVIDDIAKEHPYFASVNA